MKFQARILSYLSADGLVVQAASLSSLCLKCAQMPKAAT